MVRMNISVPDELRKRMSAFDADANWSAVAVRAFTKHLAELAAKETKSMEAGLQRLRLQREEHENTIMDASTEAGRRWAIQHAKYEELAALAAVADEIGELYDTGIDDAFGWGACLMDPIFGEGEWSRSDLEEFCESCLGERYPSLSAVQGFAEGAAEVFAEV